MGNTGVRHAALHRSHDLHTVLLVTRTAGIATMPPTKATNADGTRGAIAPSPKVKANVVTPTPTVHRWAWFSDVSRLPQLIEEIARSLVNTNYFWNLPDA